MANPKSRHEYDREFPTPAVGDPVWVYDRNAHQYIPEIVDSVIVGNANPYITIEGGHKRYELSVVWGKAMVSMWDVTFPALDETVTVYAPIKSEAIRLAKLKLAKSPQGYQLNLFPQPPVVEQLRLY